MSNEGPSGFETIESALVRCRVALAAIGEVLTQVKHAAEAGELDQTIAIWLISAGARGQGLHSAIVRETLQDNPHAVYPLVRTLLDLVMVTMQVRRDPQYVFVIVNDPATTTLGQRRKSPQALVTAGLKEMPDLRNAWNLLRPSDRCRGIAAGFGSRAPTLASLRQEPPGLAVVLAEDEGLDDGKRQVV